MFDNPEYIPLPQSILTLGAMPCEPKKLKIPPACEAPGLFKRPDASYAAMLILLVSAQLQRWRGVSYLWLWLKLEAERNAYEQSQTQAAKTSWQEYETLKAQYAKKKAAHWWACFFTLCIWALFVSAPTPPVQKKFSHPVPTGVQEHGGNYIADALAELDNEGLIVSTPNPEDEGDLFLFPTHLLVLRAENHYATDK